MPASSISAPRRLIDVALPLPVFQTFRYAVDGDPPSRNPIVPGSRVVVPLRGGRAIGICVGDSVAAGGEPSHGGGTAVQAAPRIKPILDVPDPGPAVPAALLDVCRWMADYYVVPLGIVLRSALPALLTGAARPSPAPRSRRVAVIRRHLPSLLERDQLFARAARQRQAFELLESLGGRSPADHLVERLGCSPGVLVALARRGLIALEKESVSRDPFAARDVAASAPLAPTPAQAAAIAAITAGAAGQGFLLHGITGSGKTLVYLEVLREVVDRRGQSAIVLVPEIALTPQTVDRFRAVFGDKVAVLHSSLSDGERYDAWRALRSGERRIAVGARSAIFAPLDNLGAIIVDEEHEASYKQGESPRYHAREVAVVRARVAGAVVVLGSATPSLESWVTASRGGYRLLTLPERVGGGRLPAVELIDLRTRNEERGTGARAGAGILSPALDRALDECLTSGGQSILLLNRRGFASFIQCSACGDVAACPSCSISLTYHRTPERLICHYCRYQEPPRAACPKCGGATLRQRGLGTQQVERLLSERFPAARLARMDVDTTSGKWAHADILDRVGRGEIDILLGTQMIAKGLDFPNVTLVGVIDADVGLNLPDFRASERTFQLLSQVAGRAGRGARGGRVIIQTRLPAHHALRHAAAHAYQAFVDEELPARVKPAYPPVIRLANLLCSGDDESATARLAEELAGWMQALVVRRGAAGVTVVGPAPCPIDRLKDRWRWHVLLKAEHSGSLTRVLRFLATRFEVPPRHRLRLTIDRNPVSLL